MDFYKTLGVEKNATEDEIKKAYRKLAIKFHPDKAPAGKEDEYTQKFQKITEANEVLSSPEKREIYDRQGIEGLKNPQQNPFAGDFSDFFRNFASFGVPQRQQRKNSDTVFQLDLTLKDTYKGTTKKIKITKQAIVDQKGEIIKENLEKTWGPCKSCKGQGMTMKIIQNGPMIQQFQQNCDDCSGNGVSLLKGFKIKEVSEIINIDIPKGLNNGEQRRFDKQGNCSPGVIPGDIVVVFRVADCNGFTRNGLNLEYTHPTSLSEALCGGSFNLVMLDDNFITINFDFITMKNGQVEKKMVPNLGFNGGNLVISFSITFPDLTEKQRQSLKLMF